MTVEPIFNPADLVEKIAQRGNAGKTGSGDYVGDDGVLRCGVCKEPKRHYVEVEDARNLGAKRRVVVAIPCRCEREAEERAERELQRRKDMVLVDQFRSASLMSDKYHNATFKGFKVNKYNELNMRRCMRYANGFDVMLSENQGLLLWGDVGTGKSFAAACIANYLLERKVPVIMTSFSELLKVIQEKRDSERTLAAQMNQAKLVIFDDLGVERGTTYALEKVYNIIDSRVRRELPMIITTNLTIEQMKSEVSIDYRRIYDRIFETCFPMQFTGPSWRRTKANDRFAGTKRFLDGGE